MTKPLLIGEFNPYGSGSEFALYPRPRNSAGGRLCRLVLGLDEDEYLDAFERTNLCSGKWSLPAARFEARRLHDSVASTAPFVLFGSKVATAFGLPFEPFTARPLGNQLHSFKARCAVILPHPSGLNRLWHEAGSFNRARALLRLNGIPAGAA